MYTLTHRAFDCILVSMKPTLILVMTLLCSACSLLPPAPAAHSGRQLFEQIPNWDNEAQRVCGKLTDRC